jgi:adenine/guanine phosphoribosyltransferase-like PRPP-binding protein
MMVMADPVSISASCGVLLHKTLTKTGKYVVVVDDFVAPQGSSPSSDPLIRKNGV